MSKLIALPAFILGMSRTAQLKGTGLYVRVIHLQPGVDTSELFTPHCAGLTYSTNEVVLEVNPSSAITVTRVSLHSERVLLATLAHADNCVLGRTQ
jgi:hypothetical protein